MSAWKVGVFGSNGQLGSEIVHELKEAYECDIQAIERKHIDLAAAPLDTISGFTSLVDADVIINCTALHALDICHANPQLAFHMNAFVVRAMAEGCARASKRFIHVSTDYVFSGAIARNAYFFTEDDKPCPSNIYGASKLMGEEFVLSANGRDHINNVVRVSGLFGVRPPSGKPGNFVDGMVGRIRAGKDISVVDDQITTPTCARDAARAICSIATMGHTVQWPVIHVSQGDAKSWYEFTTMIASYFPDYKGQIVPTGTKNALTDVVRPAYSALSNTLCREEAFDMPPLRAALNSYMQRKYGIDGL